FICPGKLRSEPTAPPDDLITTMIMRAQGIWYYLTTEIIYHPHWLRTQYQPAKDPLQPRGRMRTAIEFVRDKLNQQCIKIDKVGSPYKNYPHPFITLMQQMGGDILDTLEPYLRDMEVTMIIDCFFLMPGLQVPRGFFDNWLWNHATKRRGCEGHWNLIRNLFQQQTSMKGNCWKYALVQQAMFLLQGWYITISIARLYEDIYTMAYMITKGYLWPSM
ncbi:MAG: hypothetical protein GY820_38445, partial [Gammaproteobacteria bacterium]|nr:hypothetical protein [Gammaproteobacteria bacterium]